MKDKIIEHGNIQDSINLKALIEAQASNVTYIENNNKKYKEEKAKVKKLTKSSIRGRLNK